MGRSACALPGVAAKSKAGINLQSAQSALKVIKINAECSTNYFCKDGRQGKSSTQASVHAGMLVMISKQIPAAFARQHAVSKLIAGYMIHVSIHAPASPSLHLIAMYNPPMSSEGWLDLQLTTFEYIGRMQAKLQSTNSSLLVTGDFNASLCAEGRSSSRSLTIDINFRNNCRHAGLRSCYLVPAGHKAHVPPSCISMRKDREVTSKSITG